MAALLAVLVAATVLNLAPPAHAAGSDASRAVALVNAERKAAGLAPLAVHAGLTDAAEAQAARIAKAGELSHNPSLGRGISGWTRVGENVGVAGSLDSVHNALMKSKGHRENILGSYTHVGVGVVKKNGSLWIAQVFMESAWKGTFFDDDSSVHESAIERLAASRITRGCDDGKFCPSSPVTRGEMAAFIQRAMGVPEGSGNHFSDDNSSVFEGAIEALAQRGIVEPCAPGKYCPNAPMTREHMAIFLVRALGLPASKANVFVDDDSSKWQAEIQALAAADITRGCDTNKYCPNDSVTREQMATFLVRAFGV